MEEIKDFKIDLEAIKSTFKFTENKNKVRKFSTGRIQTTPEVSKESSRKEGIDREWKSKWDIKVSHLFFCRK